MRSTTAYVMALCFFGAAAHGQLQSDQVPQSRTVPVNEGLKQELDRSRYHIGTLRVQPLFSLRDFGYYGNVFGASDAEVADWRATVGGGARFIQPVGPKMYLRAEALPEYTWYRKLAERRTLGGNFGASALFLFNRMPIEIGVTNNRAVSRVSSEDERAVLTTRTHAFGRIEVEILKRLSVFAGVEADRPRYGATGVDLEHGGSIERLEHNDSAVRGGVRYRFRPHFGVGVGVESTKTHFLNSSDRDNHTHATLLLLTYDLQRTFFNAALSARRGEADRGGVFTPFSTTTGSYFIVHQLRSTTSVDVHGRRAVTYSTFGQNAYFFETRNGVGLSTPLGHRAFLRVVGETGANEYPNAASGAVKRSDRATTFGGGVGLQIYRRLTWATLGTVTKYDSNLVGLDRTLVRVTTSLSVSGDFLQ